MTKAAYTIIFLLVALFVIVAAEATAVAYVTLYAPAFSGTALFVPLALAVWWTAGALSRQPRRALDVLAVGALALLLRLAWIAAVDTQPVSDFAAYLDAAQHLAAGDDSVILSRYYTDANPNLIPFVVYEALLVRLFGPGIGALKVVNALLASATATLVYGLGARSGRKAGLLAGLAFAVYPASVTMSSVLTNQHLSLFLFVAAFAVLLRWRALWAAVLCGLLLGLGELARAIGIPVVLAVVGYLLFSTRHGWLRAVTVAGVFLFTGWLFFWLLFLPGVLPSSPPPLESTATDMYYKLAVGLNQESRGRYNADDAAVMSLPEAERAATLRALVRQRTANKTALARLFVDKVRLMWGEANTAVYWATAELPPGAPPVGDLRAMTNSVDRLCFLALITGTALYLWQHRAGWGNGDAWLWLLLVLGYAGAHLLIEIQPRYTDFLIPVFAVMAGAGMGRIKAAE